MGLTIKQKEFINEYIKCRNATEAARRAGYAYPNTEGPKNLVKPSIAEEIASRTAKSAMEADEVLQRLGDMARGSVEDFSDVYEGMRNAVFLNFDKAKERQKLHLIKKLKYNAQGYPEIELHDAQAALEKIGKSLGLFLDRTEHSGEINITFEWDDDSDYDPDAQSA